MLEYLKDKEVYDVTVFVSEIMEVYKNKEEKKPKFINTKNFMEDGAYESIIQMDCHTGTHIDAPLHFVENGDKIESIKISELMRYVKLIDLTEVDGYIYMHHIDKYEINENDFIILKTKNSFENFHINYTAISPEVAQYFVDKKISGIGVDGLSVGRGDTNAEVHKILLSNKLIVIEGLNLKEVEGDIYFMIALPLKLTGVEAAPARVILVKE